MQYFVCQNKKMFYPHSLPQGLSLPVNQPEDRADNGRDAAEFPSLKITAYEFFIGTVLKIPAGWDLGPAQYLAACLWLQVLPSFHFSHPFKRRKSSFLSFLKCIEMQPLKFQAQMIFIYAAGEKKRQCFSLRLGFFSPPLWLWHANDVPAGWAGQRGHWTPDPCSRWLRLLRHHRGSSPTCLAGKDFML